MFSDSASRQCKPTAQAVSNSEYTAGDLSASQNWWWWLRSPNSSYASNVRYVYSDGSLNNNIAYYGNWGVRPALNLSSDILVSDAPDSEGYYTIIWNNAPTTPPSITAPHVLRHGDGRGRGGGIIPDDGVVPLAVRCIRYQDVR